LRIPRKAPAVPCHQRGQSPFLLTQKSGTVPFPSIWSWWRAESAQTPFLLAAREALGLRTFGDPPRTAPRAAKVTLCYGARTSEYLAGVEDFHRAGVEVHLSTGRRHGRSSRVGDGADSARRGAIRRAVPADLLRTGADAEGRGRTGEGIKRSPARFRWRVRWRAASGRVLAVWRKSATPRADGIIAERASTGRCSTRRTWNF